MNCFLKPCMIVKNDGRFRQEWKFFACFLIMLQLLIYEWKLVKWSVCGPLCPKWFVAWFSYPVIFILPGVCILLFCRINLVAVCFDVSCVFSGEVSCIILFGGNAQWKFFTQHNNSWEWERTRESLRHYLPPAMEMWIGILPLLDLKGKRNRKELLL